MTIYSHLLNPDAVKEGVHDTQLYIIEVEK
jgi:hypothetical protein